LQKQGYILCKDELDKKTINKIRRDLTVTPYVNKNYNGPAESFKVFKETKYSLIVPKYYGIANFGDPVKTVGLKGEKVNMKFLGKLRDYQVPIVNSCLKDIKSKGGGIISLPCGMGKCLSKGTPILMFDGSIKPVEEIVIGDKLMGDDSKPRSVLSLARGKEMMYDVIPTKGPKYTVNESHILSLKYNTVGSSYIDKNIYAEKFNKGDILDISVKDYLNLPKYCHDRGSPLRGYRVPVNFEHKKIDLDPYMLGLWLGDGNSLSPQITNIDDEILEYMNDFAKKHDLELKPKKDDPITYAYTDKNKKGNNYFRKQLQKLNLLNNKHIPQIYKCNSQKVRLQVLAGFIDADGHLSHNGFDICQKKEGLIDDIIFIARSLGLATYKTECWKTCTNASGGPKKCKFYRTNIHGDTNIIPTKVSRKKASKQQQIKDVTVYGIKVKPVGVGDYYGFEIDGNHRFLLGDFTVTHNTAIAIYLACQLGLKTLIVVHKTFLQNQWYERIQQFTDAKIGIIRQNKIDIEGKDIVVGMLQSISMKDYDSDIFKSFGLVVMDECHRMPSRVFSKAFNKTNCKYTIGLSATPNRKDGLTKVIKWYIGDIIYELTRKGDNRVIVKTFTYESNDKLYGEKKRWNPISKRVAPDTVRMISNMSKMDKRTHFIVNMLDSLKDQDERKILVLSHRIEHLKQMKSGIDKLIEIKIKNGKVEQDEFKTAYYIGGMKEYELKDSEEADIIFATYAMAEEGLDIDNLNTLILATPKKDIIQSIGRIMRKPIKEGDNYPMIIDIIDNYSCFKTWGSQRINYYNSKKYTVHNYQTWNEKCITIKDYLIMNGVIKKNSKNVDIRKEFLCHKYSYSHYELEKDLGFKNSNLKNYEYSSNFDEIFNVNPDDIIVESDESDDLSLDDNSDSENSNGNSNCNDDYMFLDE
jgi:superfamily II DNA or RNA helicase